MSLVTRRRRSPTRGRAARGRASHELPRTVLRPRLRLARSESRGPADQHEPGRLRPLRARARVVWWAWSAFTWMTSAVDIESRVTKLLVLAGVAGCSSSPLRCHTPTATKVLVRVPYAFIRLLHLVLYGWGLKDRPAQLAALLRLAPFFLGRAGPRGRRRRRRHAALRTALWAASIAVDLVGVLAAGSENDWRISPAHFAERYALIVIIALGESIVAIGTGTGKLPRAGAVRAVRERSRSPVSPRSGGRTSASSPPPSSERCRRLRTESRRGPLARDIFTIFHYPIVLGIVYSRSRRGRWSHIRRIRSRPGRAALGSA